MAVSPVTSGTNIRSRSKGFRIRLRMTRNAVQRIRTIKVLGSRINLRIGNLRGTVNLYNWRGLPPLRAAQLPWRPRSCQPCRLRPGREEHFSRCASEPSRSAHGTVRRSGGSCCFGKGQVCIGDPVKSMPKPGTEGAVVDCATNLEQQIGAISRPSHLLGLGEHQDLWGGQDGRRDRR